MTTRVFFIMILILVFPAAAFALSATVQVDQNSITLEDVILMQVTVDEDDVTVDTSGIDDFKVRGAGSSTNISIINGSYQKKIIYQYQLTPKKTGDLLIPSLRVSSDKTAVVTEAVTITVTKADEVQADKKDIFATAEISADRLVMGQQAVYTFRLYSAVRFQRASLSEPSFRGFHAKAAGDRKDYTRRINGRVYNVSELNFLIIPQQTGRVEIEPAAVDAAVIVKSKRDPFGSPFFNDSFFSSHRTRPVRVLTDPLTVHVDPLPPYNGVHSPSGLVGDFSLSASMDQTDLRVGDSATLTVRITGTGNVMDAPVLSPVLDVDRFKAYDDTPVEEIQISAEGYTGFKEFKKAIVPVTSGDFSIAPVTLTYFDIHTFSYKTIQTQGFQLRVEPSQTEVTVEPVISQNTLPALKKKSVTFEQKDILTIKQSLKTIEHQQKLGFAWFCFWILLPAVIFAGFRAARAFISRTPDTAQVMENRSKDRLKKAEAFKAYDLEFLACLYSALISKIYAKAKSTGESLTCEEAAGILTREGTPSETVNRVTELIDSIEAAKFGGKSVDQSLGKTLLDRTKDTIKLLGVAILACVLIGFSPGQGLADEKAAQFLDGVKHYQNHEYDQAIQAFEALVDQGVVNGDLYYNLGNAYLRTDQTGRAILWYERARRWIPNDPDLIFNLNHANTLIIDKVDDTQVTLSDIFLFWMKYLPLNAIQVIAIGLSIIFFGLCIVLTLLGKNPLKTTGTLLLSLLILCLCLACYDYWNGASLNEAVVVAEKVTVRSGLSEDAAVLFELHAGTKVTIRQSHPTHLKIMFSKDKIGWVKLSEVIPI